MDHTFKIIKCPKCRASLPIEQDRKSIFCSFCGVKIEIKDSDAPYNEIPKEQSEHLNNQDPISVDQKGNRGIRALLTFFWIIICMALILLCLIVIYSSDSDLQSYGPLLLCFTILFTGATGYFIFTTLPKRAKEKLLLQKGGIRFPKSLEPFNDKDYKSAQDILRNSGFQNITCISKHDLILGVFQKSGRIASITVDGKEIMTGGSVYLPNCKIVITYHEK